MFPPLNRFGLPVPQYDYQAISLANKIFDLFQESKYISSKDQFEIIDPENMDTLSLNQRLVSLYPKRSCNWKIEVLSDKSESGNLLVEIKLLANL